MIIENTKPYNGNVLSHNDPQPISIEKSLTTMEETLKYSSIDTVATTNISQQHTESRTTYWNQDSILYRMRREISVTEYTAPDSTMSRVTGCQLRLVKVITERFTYLCIKDYRYMIEMESEGDFYIPNPIRNESYIQKSRSGSLIRSKDVPVQMILVARVSEKNETIQS